MQNQLRSRLVTCLVLVCGAFVWSSTISAEEADVVGAKATKSSDDTYRFDVTVAHDDTGWDHYANVWEVVGPEGSVLGRRVLAHPHVNEQPFTRSLSGVAIPSDVSRVTIRAGDLVHAFGGKEVMIDLPSAVGQSTSISP
ncbi:hypothetical protein [Thalassospira australica]|uniref:hypothetical protein n=1 Tax=Thalassospira australica TaxID=1528106 RepID=UPI00051A77F8|nr:hypothetical protein [Thalassospira australica]